MKLTHERHNQKAFLLVAIERRERRTVSVRSNVMKAGVVNRADALNSFIDAIAGRESVLPGRPSSLANEFATLHQQRLRDARNCQRRRRDIDQAYNPLIDSAGTNL